MKESIGVVVRLYLDVENKQDNHPTKKMQIIRPYLNSKFSETAKDCVTDLEYFLARRGRYTSCGDQNIRINGEEHRAIVTTYSLKYFDSKDIDKIISYTYKKNIDLYLSFPDVVKEHIENS